MKPGGLFKVTTIDGRPPSVLLTANYTCILLAWRLTRPPPPVTAKTSGQHQCQCPSYKVAPLALLRHVASFPAARPGRGGCRSNPSYLRYANAGLFTASSAVEMYWHRDIYGQKYRFFDINKPAHVCFYCHIVSCKLTWQGAQRAAAETSDSG